MKKILGLFASSKEITEAEFIKAAEECGYNKLIGMKLYSALKDYAHDLYMANKIHARDMVLSKKFLCRIPDDEVESIKGIKTAGHKIIDYLKK